VGLGDAEAEGAERRRFAAQGTLASVLETTLRLLHPFMPFVTEEIWHQLPTPAATPASLMITIYPQAEVRFLDEHAERELGLLKDVTGAIRTLRSTYGVKPSATVAADLRVPDGDKRAIIERHRRLVETMARVELAVVVAGAHVPQSAKVVIGADIEVVVPLAGLIDVEAEKARMSKELAKADKEIARLEAKLANEQFVANAPDSVVEKERARLAEERERRELVAASLAALE
jgi:valyl-tRNA synthetase